jgi:hypothetical protein
MGILRWVLPFFGLLALQGCSSGASSNAFQNTCTSSSTSGCATAASANNPSASVSFFLPNNILYKTPMSPAVLSSASAFSAAVAAAAAQVPPTTVSLTAGAPGAPQQMSLVGTCTTGNVPLHLITYSVGTNGGVLLPTDIYGRTYITNPTTPLQYTKSYSGLPGCAQDSLGTSTPSNNCQLSMLMASGLVGVCENGKFNLVLTPPLDASTPGNASNTSTSCNSCGGTSSQYNYQVTVQLWTGSSVSTLTAGPYFTGNVTIQN